ncbi:Hpt domain-containing protein [Pedobacter alpinus]|uniref:Hpt domain-containing protein n=1 Tax=Pedobacter alpinus TaxID=1590643 RepID=A0ABW5TM28_9SPHI
MEQVTHNTFEPSTHFNFERIRNYVGSDKDTINYILNLTIDELHSSLSIIENHVLSNNLKGIKDTCHKLFGTAVTVGLEKLSVLARQLEHLNQFNQMLVNDLLSKMKLEINIVVKLLKQKIN